MNCFAKSVVLCGFLAFPAALNAQQATITTEQLQNFHFRQVGPAVSGGRIHDVEALPHDPSTIYLATATGGIWKTTNKGTTWRPIFEGQPVSNFGDLAIAPSNPDVIWVGTGGQNNRQSTSWGNGVYRSTDAGETWTHLGLDDTRHIGRVRVHPRNPDVAYVAALGNLWAPDPDRGVYKTTNGGRSWQKVLYIDTLTGVVDLVMDPTDPDVLYAAAYQRQRRTWGFNGGGPGSGIYKTTNGGDSWDELTNGIPSGDKGRIGLAIAATNGQVLFALIEHAGGGRGTYRSENGGASWDRVNDLDARPMYYSHIFIDPTNEDRVYELATSFYKSEDGGRNFRTMPTNLTYDVGVHADYHSLWIDPTDTEHLYLAGDGGLYESWDRGETYIKINNIPIAQFYAIGVDHREPYNIYGGLQDNHSWMGPSATRHWIGIINDDWRQIGFGDGMFHQPDPTNTRYEYGGSNGGDIYRLDTETGDLMTIRPVPDPGEQYRFDWAPPILISRHDPRTVYFGGNRLFISHDRGSSWERTDDLTKNIDRDALELMGIRGGDITLSRNDGTGSYGELVTVAESPLTPDVLWVGADDGNIQVSQDGGATWREVSRNIRDGPPNAYVSRLLASVSAREVAYATLDAHRDGDFRPYIYRTDDLGNTWTLLTNGLWADGSVNVIKEHPQNPDLLFVGTERAVFVSVNRGAEWTHFKADLPTTLYDDMVIHPRDNDLVLGTHGRSVYVLDDLSALVEWTPQVAAAPAHVFSIRAATIKHFWKDTSYRGQAAYAGENPPDGAIVGYVAQGGADATLEIRNASGDVVRRLDVPASWGQIQRVTWDLRHETPPGSQFGRDANPALADMPQPVGPRGHFVSPGTYTATLTVANAQAEQTFRVRGDPLMTLTQEQYEEREAFLSAIVAAQRRLQDIGGDRDRSDLATRARQMRQQMGRLYSQFNGRGVRQGSLYPPTMTQRQTWNALQEEMQQLEKDFARGQ
ncbi:MAG: glycosyl hydrolase [Gemmatimonadetes bacterium]|nr:glycosyl hydrolase [Gemmatimonadota bacterium]